MRIIILSFFYHPEPNDVKAHWLAKDLTERGHEVVSIAPFPNYPYGKIYPGYRQNWRQWEEKDGVKVLRIPLYTDHSRSSLKRALSYLSFTVMASVLGTILCGKADIVWVYHPPLTTGVVGWCLSSCRRAPFVYEIQDMWPESLTATGMISGRCVLGLLERVAKFVYKRAAAITVISPGFQENLINKGVPANKIHVIPNWADETIYKPLPKDEEIGKKYNLANHFNVIFGGNMGPAQSLNTVIKAAQQLHDMPDIQFTLIGDGLDLPKLQEQAKGMANINFVERQPMEKMPSFFAWADALLIHLKNDDLFSITIPSKTFVYLASGRPIIAALSGDGAEVVQFANAGLICPPEDPNMLARTVYKMYTMPLAEREAMGKAARQAYLMHYRREIAINRYEQIFEDILARRKRKSTH